MAPIRSKFMAILQPNNWDTWNSSQKYSFASRANKVLIQLHNEFAAWRRGELSQDTYNTFPVNIKNKFAYRTRLSQEDYEEFIRVDFYRLDQAIQTAMASLHVEMENDDTVIIDLDNDVVGE
jgi:hypothetical protein